AGSLILFRSLQGLGAALLSPAALSILTTTFREGRERNLALGIWGAASGSGGAAGVLLGGALTSSLSWSWIFFINVPVGILVLAVTPFLLKESRADLGHRRFDFTGAATITGGLMLLVYALTRATQHGWATAQTTRLGIRWVLSAGLALSAVALVMFARLPVDGTYWSDLFPAFLLSGIGLALAFVPISIGGLTGVTQADAGIASGLINTSQQIGGAIGVAVATTIATTVTSNYLDVHPGSSPLG